MNRFSRRLSLLLCVLLLITVLSGCGASPAAPSEPSTPQTPTAEDEALRRAPFQPVITCEMSGDAEALTEAQQQAILSYAAMLCTALARPDDPLPEETCTTDALRADAQALAEAAVGEYAAIYDVQGRPAYFTPMQQSGDTAQVTLREVLRVDHLRQGSIAATLTSVDHTLTLRQQADGSWQVCGDSYEALGHTCAVTP